MEGISLFEMLPHELWLLITDFAAQDVLRNMCLVSKSFRLLLQPRLFHHYIQPNYGEDEILRPFMRVCIARPDLAAAVRKATVYNFADNDMYAIDVEEGQGWMSHHNRKLEKLQSQRWPAPVPKDHARRDYILSARNLALFCSLVPNLEHLILDSDTTTNFELPSVLDYAKAHWKSPTPFLSHLQRLQFDFAFEEDGLDLRYFRSLLSLPSLRILQGHACIASDVNDKDSPGPLSRPRELSIEHINFMCSVLQHDVLKELIEGCMNLKTFSLVYGEITVGAFSEYDFRVVSSALQSQKACLESLVLDFEGDTATEILEKDSISGVITLSSFERLHHVDLPAWGLLRDNVDDSDGTSGRKSIAKLLPPTLNSLVLRSCTDETVAALLGLLESLDTLPNLRDIAFTTEGEATLEGLDGFEDACREKGICLNRERLLKRVDHTGFSLRFDHHCLPSEELDRDDSDDEV